MSHLNTHHHGERQGIAIARIAVPTYLLQYRFFMLASVFFARAAICRPRHRKTEERYAPLRKSELHLKFFCSASRGAYAESAKPADAREADACQHVTDQVHSVSMRSFFRGFSARREAPMTDRIPFELLLLLAERPGKLVSRRIGEGEHFHRGRDRSIHGDSKIRRALGDETCRPRYVETVSRKGYPVYRGPRASRSTPENAGCCPPVGSLLPYSFSTT